jgi:hypothetical protein
LDFETVSDKLRTSCGRQDKSVICSGKPSRSDLHRKAGLVQIQLVSRKFGTRQSQLSKVTPKRLTSDTGASSGASGRGSTGQDTGGDVRERLGRGDTSERSGQSSENNGSLHFVWLLFLWVWWVKRRVRETDGVDTTCGWQTCGARDALRMVVII